MAIDQYAVFGNPISQSKSPIIHQHFAAATGQELEYRAQLVNIDGFEAAADAFFKSDGSESIGRGLNITTPFKDDAYAYANTLSSRARKAGAVNTLALKDDGTIFGDTTDGVGLVRDITENLGWAIMGKKVLVLGAGGAVRGILEPLLALNPDSLTIANRTASKAESLAKGFASLGNIKGSGLEGLNQSFDLIINGTSASLTKQAINLPSEIIAQNSCAYDMAYGSQPSPFMQWAEDLGAQTADGLGMLVGQAAESFRIWRGVLPETGDLIAKLRADLQT